MCDREHTASVLHERIQSFIQAVLSMKRHFSGRALLLSLVLVAAAASAPVYAQISFNIVIAPPAPVYDPPPYMAPGYVWAPGYWAFDGARHVWVRGRPIMQRDGYRWEADRWEQRGATYFRHVGRWERDERYVVLKPEKYKKEKKQKKDKHGKGHDRGTNHDD